MDARATISRWLPRGHGLGADVWKARHRLVKRIVVLHLPVLLVVGVRNGAGVFHTLLEISTIALLVAGSVLVGERWMKAVLVSAGLVTASALLVHLTHGLIESHFHFFIALPLIALYADWRPFGLSVLYVLLHHGVMGTLDPGSVYNHPAAMARPMLWGAIHAGFVALLVVVLLVHWRISEDEQAATRRVRNRLGLVIDTSRDAIFQISDTGTVTSANASAAEMLGLSDPLLAAGLVASSVIDPLPIGQADASRARAVVRHLDGTSTPVDLTVTTTEVDGEVTHAVFARNMSEVDSAMRRMEDAIRAKDELIASVSHEIRTPLTGILGISAELSASPAAFSTDETAKLLSTITEEAQDMADLVEDLLTSARARIGTLSVVSSDVNLGEVVGGALRSSNGSSAVPETRFAADVIAHGDPLRIRQIVRNLLTNAQRYGGRNVELSTSAVDGWAVVAVSDDGDALPREVVENMFLPYFTGATGETRPRAIGLGLAVSADLARAMGGELSFERRDGRNRFLLHLPLALSPVPVG